MTPGVLGGPSGQDALAGSALCPPIRRPALWCTTWGGGVTIQAWARAVALSASPPGRRRAWPRAYRPRPQRPPAGRGKRGPGSCRAAPPRGPWPLPWRLRRCPGPGRAGATTLPAAAARLPTGRRCAVPARGPRRGVQRVRHVLLRQVPRLSGCFDQLPGCVCLFVAGVPSSLAYALAYSLAADYRPGGAVD